MRLADRLVQVESGVGTLPGTLDEKSCTASNFGERDARSELPDVPTFKESGFPDVGFDPDVWQAIVAPLGTPAPVVNKLNAEINAALRSDDVQATFNKLRFQPMINSPEQFGKFLAVQAERWPPIIKVAGLKAQ